MDRDKREIDLTYCFFAIYEYTRLKLRETCNGRTNMHGILLTDLDFESLHTLSPRSRFVKENDSRTRRWPV